MRKKATDGAGHLQDVIIAVNVDKAYLTARFNLSGGCDGRKTVGVMFEGGRELACSGAGFMADFEEMDVHVFVL
eukprot:COSAG05_NODE_4839_length_1353_cov_3.623604_2_plen_74_part_00